MTGIAGEYLELVSHVAATIPLPAVHALHLPPEDATGHVAEFCALELVDGSVGLSYLWLGYGRAHLGEVLSAEPLEGRAAHAVARWYAGADPARRALGFAAVNAISQHLFARAGFVPDATISSVALAAPGRRDHVGMIGLFSPLVPRILATGARLTVAELNPALVREGGLFRVTLDRSELSACNKILSTSTVLLNDTIDDVLASCRGSSYVGIVGPGASCFPDPLFARRVSTVGGSRVVAREQFLGALAAGRRWVGVEKYCIQRDAYPGVEALLSRART